MFVDFKKWSNFVCVRAYFDGDPHPILEVDGLDYPAACKVVENCTGNPRFARVEMVQTYRLRKPDDAS